MNNPSLWPNFAERVGRPELSKDSRFSSPEARSKNSKALIQALDEIFATKTRQEWRDILNEMGLTFGEVQSIADVPKDRQMLESGALRRIDDPNVGVDLTIDSPVWMEGAEKMPVAPAPTLGEHTVEVLRKAGYDDADIDRLRKAEAIP